MANLRHKNSEWKLPSFDDGQIKDWTYVQIAVLMDIRDELQTLNRLLGCKNCIAIPQKLERIARSAARVASTVDPKQPRRKDATQGVLT